jgi:hypothetical protein
MINSEEVEKSILNKSLIESKLPSLDQRFLQDSLNQQAFLTLKKHLGMRCTYL